MREILFLCTGNYYRSRLAEALFNHEADRRGLAWRAFSRGLATYLAPPHGLSPVTTAELRRRGIPLARTAEHPVQVQEADFQRAQRVIALREAEHRPMLAQLHPDWETRVDYWHIGDLDVVSSDEGVTEIEANVRTLLTELHRAKPD